MLYARLRLILVALFFIIGLVLHVLLGFGSAWYLYLGAGILLATHFLFGTVWVAFSYLKKGKLERAERLIDATKRPEWLLKGHRAYYHFTKGMILLRRKQTGLAKPHLKEALRLGLRTSTDKALTNLNLAHLHYVEQKLDESEHYLEAAKAIPTDDLLIQQNIEQLEKALPNARKRLN